MVTLRQFVAKKPAKKKAILEKVVPPPAQVVEDRPQSGKISRARKLYLVYAGMQRKHGVFVVPYNGDKRMRTCFRKLAEFFEENKADGHIIDENAYMQAHRITYGRNLRPNHLISWCSYNIYQNYLTAQRAEDVTLSKKELIAYDEELIQHYCSVRGESREEVIKLLKLHGFL